MGTVVVTGAAGSLGRRVVASLARGGHDRVIAVDVHELDGQPQEVETHVFDLAGDADSVDDRIDAAIVGADRVIHLAWQAPAEGRRVRPELDPAANANHRALRRILAAAARAHVRGFVHLSSATVYGAWPDNQVPLSEEAPLRPNPELAFAVGKGDAERLVADWAEAHPEVAVTVLRPAPVIGSTTQPLYRALVGTGVPRWDELARRVQFLHVDDLAAAVVLASRDRLRGAFNVAPDSGTRDDTARDLAGGVARIRLPGRLGRLVASWGWGLSRSGAPRAARAYGNYPWVVAPDRLKAAGWRPLYSSEEALVETDPRAHWDDLPPGTRQNYTLLVAVVASVVAAASGVSVAVVIVRRRRSRPATAPTWAGSARARWPGAPILPGGSRP